MAHSRGLEAGSTASANSRPPEFSEIVDVKGKVVASLESRTIIQLSEAVPCTDRVHLHEGRLRFEVRHTVLYLLVRS